MTIRPALGGVLYPGNARELQYNLVVLRQHQPQDYKTSSASQHKQKSCDPYRRDDSIQGHRIPFSRFAGDYVWGWVCSATYATRFAASVWTSISGSTTPCSLCSNAEACSGIMLGLAQSRRHYVHRSWCSRPKFHSRDHDRGMIPLTKDARP